MDKKYIIASSFVAFAVLLTGVLATNAAFRGEEGRGMGLNLDPDKKAEMQEKRSEMKEQMEAKHAEMQEIMERGDYNTWRAYTEVKQAERFNILDVNKKELELNFVDFIFQNIELNLPEENEIDEGLEENECDYY